MSKIKGQNFRIAVGGAVVPEATNCSVTISGNAEDTSTKDTTGLFSQETVTSRNWQVQVDSYDAEPANLRTLMATFLAGSAVSVGFDKYAGTGNATANTEEWARGGDALLTDITLSFNDRQTVSVSSQYQGTGELV